MTAWHARYGALPGGRAAYLLGGLSLGALSALAYAPLHLFPALVIAQSGLFLLLARTNTACGALALGWAFGFGSFVVGLHWITVAFGVDAERFGPLAIPALLGLAAGLALFPALALGVARLLAGSDRGLHLLLTYAALWSAGEWLRGTLLTGFPWNLAAHAWGFADAPLQSTAVVGTYGLGLITTLASTLPALALLPPRRAWPVALSAALVALLWGYGTARLSTLAPADVSGIRLRLVLPDVAQSLKWAPEERDRLFARLLELARTPADGPRPTHVILPETAVPTLLAEDEPTRAALAAVVPPGGALLTGAVRRAPGFDRSPAMRNSILVLDQSGTVISDYDKIRLVPFGEYMPLRDTFPAIPKLTAGSVDFSPGPPRAPLPIPGLPPAWPLICYEAIFPHALPADVAPGWILVLTNDAWFGTSWGPYQHALAARLRAVELGLPMVRVANGGLSFVSDARGVVREVHGFGVPGVLDTALPGALPGGTIYARFGDVPFGITVFAFVALGFATNWRQKPSTVLVGGGRG